jgi:hypothetical protein
MEKYLSSLTKEMFVEQQIKMNGTETCLIQINSNKIEVLIGDDYCGKNSCVVNMVSAEIEDNAIEIVNCIRTGITKQSFIERLNLKDSGNLNDINVVEISSVLAGIWHYYTFDDKGMLNRIKIQSDFVFE